MDPVHFSGKEVLEMAVKIEENGLKFYNEAGRATNSRELKELFETLADEEESHIETFNELRKLAGDTGNEGFDPYLQEAVDYLRALADTEVFTNSELGAQLAEKVTGEADALDYAIDMEKDSLLFYYELQKMIREKDRDVLEQLIEQEKDHVSKLRSLKKKLIGKAGR